jgi:hypothetical protein
MSEAENDNITIDATPFTRVDPGSKKKKLVLKPVPIAIGLVFILLSLAALFMFTARAVRLNISPSPDHLAITTGFFSYRLGERFLMLPGDYVISAELQGYRTLSEPVQVGDDPDQDFDFEMTKLPGILTIASIPEVGAEVFIDQASVGKTPLIINNIDAGLHDISLRSERYLAYESEIVIEGKRLEQELKAHYRQMPPFMSTSWSPESHLQALKYWRVLVS